ncbi:MAG: hypothetical protein AB7I19_16890 [Planctomycetota bacterium]
MNPIPLFLSATLVASIAVPVPGPVSALGLPSDPHGIYAIVESARLVPNEQSPERLELSGAFSVAIVTGRGRYATPTWGRIALTAPEKGRAECIEQWRAVVAAAGTGEVIAFSSRYEQRDVRVVPPGPDPAPAGVMGASFDVWKVTRDDWGPAIALQQLCRPLSPVGELAVESYWTRDQSGEITFEFANCVAESEGLRFMVTARTRDEFVSSPLLTPGKERTSWKTRLSLVKGTEIEWTVVAVGLPEATHPVAAARCVVASVKE